ncbi:hypothetical protein U9M48_006813 [Paspalum notatum var. saurae]|uniref:Uncharacterized protein n=1 Tax=Paspalum notatum var. saurae TaxID=547442 RepID=A0AAQ3Q0M8_PASNO
MYPAKICECLRNLLDSRYANAEEAEGSAPGAAPASAVVAPLATHDDAAAVPAEGTALAAALTSADVAPQAAALVSMLAAEGGALVARRGRKPSTRAASASVKATPLAAHDDEVAMLAKGSAPAATLVSADVSPRAASPVSVLAADGGAPVARRERKPNSRVFGSQWTAFESILLVFQFTFFPVFALRQTVPLTVNADHEA